MLVQSQNEFLKCETAPPRCVVQNILNAFMVTGFGLFQEFIVAAALPDGQASSVYPLSKRIKMHWARLPSVSRWLWQR